MPNQLTEESFLQQTQGHQLTISREDGIYRHLHVGKPGTICESWDICTWPGYLAMVGDMGNWVFQRREDMFEFFRSPLEKGLKINPHYWAEKLEAQQDGEWHRFSPDIFHKRVEELAVEACDVEAYSEVPEERKDDLWGLLNTEDEWDAVAAVRDFNSDWLDLTDFWESPCREVREHFIFACYAITWTVQLYDAMKQKGGAA